MKIVNELFEEALQYQRETIGRLLRMQEHEPMFAAIQQELAKVNVVNFAPDSVGMSFDITVAGPKESLQVLFKVLRKHGYEPGSRPKEGETQHYTFWTCEDKPKIWTVFTSTSCRRVQVGTKTVEQPIYETVCDEVEPYAAG